MRVIRLTGLVLALVCFRLPAPAQLYSPPAGGPLSAFEYQQGTYTTTGGHNHSAVLKLQFRTEPGRSGGDDERFATLVVQTPNGPVRPDSAASFSFDQRRFVNLSQLTPDRSLRDDLKAEFVEVFQDTGRIELYGYYPNNFRLFGLGNHYVLASYTPGVIREDDLVRSFIWRRRGTPGFDVLVKLPPRGYNPDFERQLRGLFADRPDILKYVDSHDIRGKDLPAVVKAYNSGLPIRFE